MKTITLTEDAYERLLSWKDSPRDSFSKVVLKKVPKRGTLGDLAEAIQQLPPLTDHQYHKLMETYDDHRKVEERDPWKD